MRRSTPDVEPTTNLHLEYARAVASLSLEAIERRIGALDPFATDARRARFASVLDARIASITVLLDSMHDPYNGAAVVRSCDVFGIARLHVIERKEPFVASRAVSRGSEQWVDVIPHPSGVAAADSLEARGFTLIATHPEGTLTPSELRDLSGPLALVLGNERDGIEPGLQARCAHTVRVPMRGFAESLNVSVTTAILLHELTRDRPGDLPPLDRAQLYLRGLLQTVPRATEILEATDLRL